MLGEHIGEDKVKCYSCVRGGQTCSWLARSSAQKIILTAADLSPETGLKASSGCQSEFLNLAHQRKRLNIKILWMYITWPCWKGTRWRHLERVSSTWKWLDEAAASAVCRGVHLNLACQKHPIPMKLSLLQDSRVRQLLKLKAKQLFLSPSLLSSWASKRS